MIFRPKTSLDLIAAITSANSQGGSHTIYLARKKYILDSVQSTDTDNRGLSGLPQITCNLTIEGNGATLERLSSGPNFRFFHILSTATLDLRNLNLIGGYLEIANALGGAIRNKGILILFRCHFQNNRVFGVDEFSDGYGGAILNELPSSQLTMSQVSIVKNIGENGAIFNVGTLNADACIFLSNVGISIHGGLGIAGGLYNAPGGDALIEHSLFEGNVAANGAAIRTDGNLTVDSCSFTRNHAKDDGSAIYVPYLSNYPSITIDGNEFYDNASTSLSCVYNHPNNTQLLIARNNYWGASDGPSGNGPGSGEPVSTNVDFMPFNTQPIAPSCDGGAYCGVNYAADDMVTSNNPISLRLGEKRLEVTDLSLNTPAGSLAFTRTFRQSKVDNTPLMGLGWSHNHFVMLTLTGSSSRVASVDLPNGGILILNEVGSSGHFEGVAGSTCVLDYDTTPNEFILTTQNKDQYIFEPISGGSSTEYRLRKHLWNSGETWTYHYYAGSDQLQWVEDAYGNQLQFSYRPTINDPFDAAQLWRVGDRYATDLDGTSPSGNYIEFTYAPEAIDGQPLQVPQPLLATVRDVRGYIWTYRYYGQELGEQTTSFANFMTRRLSPSVDITGDGIADEQLILERITYPSSSAIVQERGILSSAPSDPLLSTAFDFSDDLSTTTTIDGHIATHRFDKGMYAGAENSAGYAHQSHNSQFRPISQVDANSNATLLNWSGDGRSLEKVTDAEGNITSFAYNADATLSESMDAEGRRTLYFYSPTSPRQPRLTVVVDGEEIALNGNMEVDGGWSNIAGASPQVNQQSPSHVHRGNYSRYVAAASMNQGIEGNNWNLIANQLCTITAHVYVVAGQILMQVPGVTAFDRTSSGTGTWQTLTAAYTPTSSQNSLRLQFVANQANTRFYVDSVSIYQDTVGELVINGDMETSGDWTDISGQAPQVNIQSPLHADTGQYARYVEAASVNQGIESIAWDLEADQSYTILARVLVMSGAVKMQVPGVTAFGRTTSITGAWQTLLASYEPTSTQTSRHLQFVAAQANTQFYVDSIIVVRGAILQVQEFHYDAKDRVLSEKLLSAVDGTLLRETVRTYYAAGSGNGLLRSIRQCDLTNSNDLTTTYFYDTVGRVAQTNQSSAFGSCTRSRTIYDAAGNVVASLCNFDLDTSGTPSASSGQAGSAFDEDPTTYWQSTGLTNEWLQYDFGAGNAKALTSITLRARDTQLDEMPNAFTLVGSNDGSNWSSPILSISGEPAWFSREAREYPFNNVTPYCYWRLNIQAAYAQATQISLAEFDLIPSTYPANVTEALALRASTANPDQNRLTVHEYDPLGRRTHTRVNVGTSEEMTTLTVYDALNRVVRTVSNFVAATAPANPYTAARSAFSNHGPDNTQNLVTDTAYNARGLVESQTDILGNVSRYVYDDAGRQVKVIQNYVSNGVDPALWVWNNNRWENGSGVAISYGTNNDQNLISTSEYDANGNLIQTRDVLGKMNRTVYDALNRVVKTVRNWQSSGTGYNTDPTTWVWDSAQSRWEDATGQPIPFGASNDQNLVTQTKYDAMGRVVRTQDETGEWTLFGYDPLGRQVRVIRNAVQSNYNLAIDPDLDQYNIDVNLPDQDILTLTVYSKGRVDYTQDVNGSKTKFSYDGLGRQVKVVQNWQSSGGTYFHNPDSWRWDEWQSRWEDGSDEIPFGANKDQNIIAATNYDDDGRVRYTQDVLGRKAWHVYDNAGREIRTIVNCTYNGIGTAPENPAYVGSPDSDKDIITQTVYDAFGRVSASIDTRGNETRYFYDSLGRRTRTIANYIAQGATDPAAWFWNTSVNPPRWQDGSGGDISHGTNNDENLISEPTYDLAGRVIASRDPSGKVIQQVYDQANRRIRTVANYVVQASSDPAAWWWDPADQRWEDGSGNAISHGADFDLNLISETTYNVAGQVVATRDARGTQTGFIYDGLGRRQQVIQAEGSPLASKAYTAYDKGGRVARSVRNWQSAAVTHNPDPLTWTWNATLQRWEDNGSPVKSVQHGVLNDQNLPMAYTVDKMSRVVSMTSPVGSITSTVYYKDGRVKSTTDPLGYVTEHRYDGLRRLRRVIQAYLSNGIDPANWIWDVTQWEDGSNNPINHNNPANDRNIIADVTLDVAGRQTAIRDPRGNLTTYAYDLLNRRTGLTNPLGNTWATAYADLSAGQSRVTGTLPSPLNHQTEQNFDRLGRIIGINYLNETPKNTPDVAFSYDLAGNRTLMREFAGATTIRRTEYTYDAAHRLSQVGFDNDGNGTVDQTVSYDYDRGGLRTRLTLPDGKTITYTYDPKGQLVSLTDWTTQHTDYSYDQAGRLVAMERPNNLKSTYTYDPASRLERLQHNRAAKLLGHFTYEMDARGNRTKAVEVLPRYDNDGSPSGPTVGSSSLAVDYYRGTWTSVTGGFMQTTEPGAAFRLLFVGQQAQLVLGTNTDHGICDVYVDGTFWRSIDSYATSEGQDTSIILDLAEEGPHVLEVRNSSSRHREAQGWKLRFKELNLLIGIPYDAYSIEYGYDALARLSVATDYYGLHTAPASIHHQDIFTYDVAGNRTREQSVVPSGPPKDYTYDAANRLATLGISPILYDAAGRLLSEVFDTYTWDRAGRLQSADNVTYTYNGLGQRLSRTASGTTTTYLLDMALGLPEVLTSTIGTSTTRYLHDPSGLNSQQQPTNAWVFPTVDGLGNVRGLHSVDAPTYLAHYAPYGATWSTDGTNATMYGFTGEPVDGNLVYLRARHYNTFLGVFPSLDPLEGSPLQPMSLNRYAYVHGNPVNAVDPSGLIREKPDAWAGCSGGRQTSSCFQDCINGGGALIDCSMQCGGLRFDLNYGLSTAVPSSAGQPKVFDCREDLVTADGLIPCLLCDGCEVTSNPTITSIDQPISGATPTPPAPNAARPRYVEHESYTETVSVPLPNGTKIGGISLDPVSLSVGLSSERHAMLVVGAGVGGGFFLGGETEEGVYLSFSAALLIGINCSAPITDPLNVSCSPGWGFGVSGSINVAIDLKEAREDIQAYVEGLEEGADALCHSAVSVYDPPLVRAVKNLTQAFIPGCDSR